MELQQLEDLIRKYNEGLASPAEETLLKNWYDQLEGKSNPLSDPYMRTSVKLRLESQLEKYINQQNSSTKSVHTPNKIILDKPSGTFKKALSGYAVAASVIGIMVIGGIKLFSKPAKFKEENAVVRASIPSLKAALTKVSRTIENGTKEPMTATLSDGSLVTLYPGSMLKYLPEFEKDKRTLYLTGKAIFKVRKDKSRPFTVYAAGIATTALGTLFQVSVLAGLNVSVTLMEGSIKVWPEDAARNDSVVLRPGDKMVVNSNKFNNYKLDRKGAENTRKLREESIVTPANEANAMVFKNDRLKEVFKKLSQKFEIVINYETVPGIEKELFTGKFLEDDNLEFIFKTICDLHGCQYAQNGKVLTISKKKSGDQTQ